MGRWKPDSKEKKSSEGENVRKKEEETQIAVSQPAIGQIRDANGRRIFKNASLCAQFLKDNLDIPALKDVKPEDIIDVTEKYQAYLGIQFETDTVKRIKLHISEVAELFLVSLIEHKSKVDYNVSMQLLRYMTCIWTEYAREMEDKQEGISRTKAFRYPPILPIVYYEGSENWTADIHLQDRVYLKEVFGAFIPDFTYKVVRIHDYTNEELLNRENEMSFLMMINRIQNKEDLEAFLRVEQSRVKGIVDKASPQVLEIIAETIWSLCMKMNVPLDEAEECVRKVKERNMGYLFENMEKLDIQEERRKTKEALKNAEDAWRLAQEVKNRADEAESRADEAESRAKEAEEYAEKVKRQAEEMRKRAIPEMVAFSKQLGLSQEKTAQKLMDVFAMERETAMEKTKLYWIEKDAACEKKDGMPLSK